MHSASPSTNPTASPSSTPGLDLVRLLNLHNIDLFEQRTCLCSPKLVVRAASLAGLLSVRTSGNVPAVYLAVNFYTNAPIGQLLIPWPL